ncbi:MAG: tyrosine-type recombinase/integrase [Pseudomonadales bacterium]|jgi:integrase|nr:tyrosine-type recombinase/integrase [Pseudomonadales bacterium]
MLTVQEIRNAKAADKAYKLYDRDGLYLFVSPAGGKLWRGKYRVDGKEKTLSIGPFPKVSLAEARDKWRNACKLDDPSAAKQAEKQSTGSKAPTFLDVAKEWHSRQLHGWTRKHAAQVWSTLEADIFPELGSRPIDAILPREIMVLIEAIEDRGAGEVAARVLQRVRAVFSRAVALGYRDINPASELHRHLKPRQKGKQTALDITELPGFLRALESYDGDVATRLGLRLLILTLARTSEIREAKWAEFDLEERVWTVPDERMKNRLIHRVPLSRQALATLQELHKVSGHTRWLMPGRIDIKPVSENTMLFAVYRMGFHRRTTVHGFRALGSTILNEAVAEIDGRKQRMWSVDAVERALAHVEQNKVKGAYDRGDRFEERVLMMQWWADYLDEAATQAPA